MLRAPYKLCLFYLALPFPQIMRKISHIIWDWNGTLLDDTRAALNSINKMLGDRNLAPLSMREYRNIFGFPVSDFYRRIGFELESEDWDTMAVEFHDLFLADQSISLHSDVEYILRILQQKGFSQSVLSASKQSILDTMIDDYGLNDFFMRIRGINNLYGNSKKSVGRELIATMGISPEKIVMIGDSLHDYEVAADLNINCVLVACGHQSGGRLAEAGVPVLNSLSGVVDVFCN